MARSGNSQSVRFGVFELDLRAGELRRNGSKLRLQEQPFQVLAALVEKPGEVVLREELRERLWSDDAFGDFDHSLSTAINKIRQVLGDSATHPRFVETIPRRGYRFVYPLSGSGAAASDENAVPPPGPPILKGLLVLGAGAALAYLFWPEPEVFRRPPETVPLTRYDGEEIGATFSPDGNQVAFVWNGGADGDNFDIYLQPLGGGAPVRLISDPADDYSPVWSPDGRSIAFLRLTKSSYIDSFPTEEFADIYLIPATGGPEQRLARARFPSIPWGGPQGSFLAWSPDSQRLVFAEREALDRPHVLSAVDKTSRAKWRLTDLPSGWFGDSRPAVSPDGARLVFTRARQGHTGRIWGLDLDENFRAASEPELLVEDCSNCENAVFLPGTRRVLYQDRPLGSYQTKLFLMELGGVSDPNPIAELPEEGSLLAVALDGSLAYLRRYHQVNMWRGRLAGRRLDGQAAALLASGGMDIFADYSPDGERIAFQSNRSGVTEIWICNRDGTNCRQLTSMNWSGSPTWSPNGTRIAFDASRAGAFNVYVIDAEGGQATLITEATKGGWAPDWSPDGAWIYFVSTRTGRSEIWKKRVAGGEALQLTNGGGDRPSASSDGLFVFYGRDGGVWKVPKDGGAETLVVEPIESSVSFEVAPDGLFYARRADIGEDSKIFFHRFEDGADIDTGIATPPENRVANVDIALSPNGSHLLYRRVDHTSADIALMKGLFETEVER